MHTTLQENIPTFLLAMEPVYKRQDFVLMRYWINQIMLWGGHNDIMVIGLRAFEDAEVCKFYIEQFEKEKAKKKMS